MGRVAGIGHQDFEKIRINNIFYIDKTHFIKEWWETDDKVTLITRPRRFGKTLNMSMLKCFFETGSDRTIFDGLEIVGDTELCDRYSGRFFVSSLSLKGAERQQEEN